MWDPSSLTKIKPTPLALEAGMIFRILACVCPFYVCFLSVCNQLPYNRSSVEHGKMAAVTHDYVNWYQCGPGLPIRQRPRLTLIV